MAHTLSLQSLLYKLFTITEQDQIPAIDLAETAGSCIFKRKGESGSDREDGGSVATIGDDVQEVRLVGTGVG